MGNSRENIFFGEMHRKKEDPVQEYWRNYSGWSILDMKDGVKIINIPKSFQNRITHFKVYMREEGYKILGTRESADHIFISYKEEE